MGPGPCLCLGVYSPYNLLVFPHRGIRSFFFIFQKYQRETYHLSARGDYVSGGLLKKERLNILDRARHSRIAQEAIDAVYASFDSDGHISDAQEAIDFDYDGLDEDSSDDQVPRLEGESDKEVVHGETIGTLRFAGADDDRAPLLRESDEEEREKEHPPEVVFGDLSYLFSCSLYKLQ